MRRCCPRRTRRDPPGRQVEGFENGDRGDQGRDAGRSGPAPEIALEEAFREEWGRLLALLVAQFRRLDLVEDALGGRRSRRPPGTGRREACPATRRRGCSPPPGAGCSTGCGPRRWPRARSRCSSSTPQTRQRGGGRHGRPRRPRGGRAAAAGASSAPTRRWRRRSPAALALRLVVGVPTADIARLFLVPEPTMAARLTRAKRKPRRDRRRRSACPTTVPPATRGSASSRRSPTSRSPPATHPAAGRTCARRPRRRGRPAVPGAARGAPGEPALDALLALMLLQHSRRDARVGSDGLLGAAARPGPWPVAPRRDRRGARAARATGPPPPRGCRRRATSCRR